MAVDSKNMLMTGLLFGILLLASCKFPETSPFNKAHFSKAKMEEDVKDKKCRFAFNLMPDGTLNKEFYIYTDSSMIEISYDSRRIVQSMKKYDKYGSLMTSDEYYADGQLLSHTGFLSGVMHGEYFRYYKDGRMAEHVYYDMGFNRLHIKYDEQGRCTDSLRGFRRSEVKEYNKSEMQKSREEQANKKAGKKTDED